MVSAAYWRNIADSGSGVQLIYTAYSVNATSLDGAAAQVSGTYRLPDDYETVDLMRQFESLDSFPGVVPAELLVPVDPATKVATLDGLALQLSDMSIDDVAGELNLSAVTFDSNLNPLTTPVATGTLDGTNYWIKGAHNLWKQLAGGIADPTNWTEESWDTEESTRAYPFSKGVEADLIREAAAATRTYFRYGIAFNDGAPFLCLSRSPVRIVPGGFSNFKRRRATGTTSKSVTVNSYRSVGKASGLIWSATDVYQVASNETQEFRVTMNGTPNPNRLLQPSAANAVPSIPYTGTTSIYVVTGADGFVVPAARWTGQGGKLTIAIGESPSELVITIKGPDDPSLSPFTITEGPDHPALYVCANGFVTTDVVPLTLSTGAVDRDYNSPTTEPVVIDNQFIVTDNQALDAAVAAISTVSGAVWEVDFSFTEVLYTDPASSIAAVHNRSVDQVIGAVFYYQNVMWRIVTLTYDIDNGTYSGTARWHTQVGDFDQAYTGMTCGQFQAILDAKYPGGITCGEFLHAPLPDRWDEDR